MSYKMNDLYAFGLIVVVPLLFKYILFSLSVDTFDHQNKITICLYGSMNNYTVPIMKEINKLKVPTMIAVENLKLIPDPMIQYVNSSSNYKFIPYVKSGTAYLEVDAVAKLSNTSLIIIQDSGVVYGNKTVLRPSYTVPAGKYSDLNLMVAVWDDFKQKKIHGLVMIPYNNASYHYVHEFIHDIIRFNLTINTDWWNM